MDRERPFRVRQRAVVRSTDSGNSYKQVYLIGKGETPLRRGRGVADRLDRAGQIGDDFTDRNQLAVFTLLHSFSFSHARQTERGHVQHRLIPETPSPGPAPPAAS